MNKVDLMNRLIEVIEANINISRDALPSEFCDKIAETLVENGVIILDETLALAMHAGAKAIDSDPALRLASKFCKFPYEPEKRRSISYEEASDILYDTGSLFFYKDKE